MEQYERVVEFTVRLRGEPIQVAAKAGLEAGGHPSDAAILCAEQLTLAPDENVLLLNCGNAVLGVALSRQLSSGQLLLSDPSMLALAMARRTLALNGVKQASLTEEISLLPDRVGRFDRVVILAPHSRALARRWLVEAHHLLRPGGRLCLAGANRGGIQPLIGDAGTLFGAASLLGIGRGCRVAEAMRAAQPPAAPEWARAPGIAPGSWHRIEAALPGGPCELASLPGIFSYDRIDAGTAFLLASLELPKGARVLDIGCGYGAIGVAAALAGASWVDMLDVNLLAVAAARHNIARHNLQATARASDGVEAAPEPLYDLIISNPPFHAGQQVTTTVAAALIAQSRRRLGPGGRMALVANRFLAYDKLLATHFTHVVRLAESRAYHVLVGTV